MPSRGYLGAVVVRYDMRFILALAGSRPFVGAWKSKGDASDAGHWFRGTARCGMYTAVWVRSYLYVSA